MDSRGAGYIVVSDIGGGYIHLENLPRIDLAVSGIQYGDITHLKFRRFERYLNHRTPGVTAVVRNG
jgi:hypothetical protein